MVFLFIRLFSLKINDKVFYLDILNIFVEIKPINMQNEKKTWISPEIIESTIENTYGGPVSGTTENITQGVFPGS